MLRELGAFLFLFALLSLVIGFNELGYGFGLASAAVLSAELLASHFVRRWRVAKSQQINVLEKTFPASSTFHTGR